jgi:Mg2+/Co2+ transporter CorC
LFGFVAVFPVAKELVKAVHYIATIEELVEQLVGDISDEYDTVNEDKIDRRLRRGVSSTD